MAETTTSLTPYGYGTGNPIKFIDPNGMENIIYLTFIFHENQEFKFTLEQISLIIERAQQILDNAGVNASVIGTVRNSAYSKAELKNLDSTDRIVYLSDKKTLKSTFGVNAEPAESNNSFGFVNFERFLDSSMPTIQGDAEGVDVNKYKQELNGQFSGPLRDAFTWIGRTAIHEAFHTLPGGAGHSNGTSFNKARYGDVMENGDNMMKEGAQRDYHVRFPQENRPGLLKFATPDMVLIRAYYNRPQFYRGEVTIDGFVVPKDNFRQRLKNN